MSVENLMQPSYHEACPTLPPVCQAGVKDVLDRLQRMEESGSWFKKRTPEELNLLIPQIQEHAKNIFKGLLPYKNADNSWSAALDVARSTALGADRSEARNVAGDVAWDVAGDVAWDAARGTAWNAVDAAQDAARSASWEVVKDLPGFETNPFIPFLSLYELGAVGIKFHEVEEIAGNEEPEEMLIVHFPLKLEDDRPVLACLTFPDGRPGDKTVQYTHS